jgi:hypothetical protein
MASDAALGLFDRLAVWSRGDLRAPHKPLLVLYALGRLARGDQGGIPFGEVDRDLRQVAVGAGRAPLSLLRVGMRLVQPTPQLPVSCCVVQPPLSRCVECCVTPPPGHRDSRPPPWQP